MIARELKLLFFALCLIITTATYASAGGVIYVAGDGTGTFNCDGNNDQVEINQALRFVSENPDYTTVHLNGSFTYTISDSILIGSDTILEGDSSAKVKLVNNAGWEAWKPLIKQMGNSGNNITVRGFEIDANHDGNSGVSRGKGFFNIMHFTYVDGVTVHDMYLHDGHGDGLRAKYCKNVLYYNNVITKLGHDGLYAIDSDVVEAFNNKITGRTNSCLRVWNSNNVKLHDNFLTSVTPAGPGMQIQYSKGKMNVEIYNNTVKNMYGSGMWIVGTTANYPASNTYIHVYNNIFENTGTNKGIDWVGGIVWSCMHNVVVENNIFDGSHGACIESIGVKGLTTGSQGSNFTATLRNNIIMNTIKRNYDGSNTGYAAINYLSGTHTIIMENNCLWNNLGNYQGCSSNTDMYRDPEVNSDYSLSVTSPCIPLNIGLSGSIGKYENVIMPIENNSDGEEIDDNITYEYFDIFDDDLEELTTEDIYNNQLYLDADQTRGGAYKNIIDTNIDGHASAIRYNSPAIAMFMCYANIIHPFKVYVENYMPVVEFIENCSPIDERLENITDACTETEIENCSPIDPVLAECTETNNNNCSPVDKTIQEYQKPTKKPTCSKTKNTEKKINTTTPAENKTIEKNTTENTTQENETITEKLENVTKSIVNESSNENKSIE